MKTLLKIISLCIIEGFFLLTACSIHPKTTVETSTDYPTIFPDYTEVTIPTTIAPLNFLYKDAEHIQAEISDVEKNTAFIITGKDCIQIPEKKWKQLLQSTSQIEVTVSVWNKEHPQGITYQTFPIYITQDNIDSHIVYRLIDPGYEPWQHMGIYQRELDSFTEKVVVSTLHSGDKCINCHTFHKHNPSTFIYHKRGPGGGAILVKDGKQQLVDFTSLGKKQQGVYPSWHPNGRYIAISSNKSRQSFTSEGNKVLEVYDLESDMMLLDTEKLEVLNDDRLNGSDGWETFPTWSPNGKYLYFCSATPVGIMPHDYNKVKYALVKIGFDEQTATFTEEIDTLYHPAYRGGSVSHPRISTDGRYLLYSEAYCGTFPIWHSEAELRIMDLQEKKELDTRILNSPESESFHNWSSNGRWIVFVSRRMDGRHTRLYFAHFGKEGNIGKPFMLPQYDPKENLKRVFAYNVPEFVTAEVHYEPKN